jgi:hypothetical protein
MQGNDFSINHHAAQRMAQRNVNFADLEIVLRFGRVLHRTGAEFYFLAKRDLPDDLQRQFDYLVGATVILENEKIITVYRNRRTLSRIRRKRKHRLAA